MGRWKKARLTCARRCNYYSSPSTVDESPSVISDSEPDIEGINKKAGELLGYFTSFNRRNGKTSTESDSRGSSAVPAKRSADSTVTPTTSTTSNGGESN
ncbi:hypothetical protein FQN49_007627, partial [Arthroderma sp. PD_2]